MIVFFRFNEINGLARRFKSPRNQFPGFPRELGSDQAVCWVRRPAGVSRVLAEGARSCANAQSIEPLTNNQYHGGSAKAAAGGASAQPVSGGSTPLVGLARLCSRRTSPAEKLTMPVSTNRLSIP